MTRTKPDTPGQSIASKPDRTGHPPVGGVRVRPSKGGRPRLEGDRSPCGRLKRVSANPPASGIGSLTFIQGEALRRFSKDAERSEATRDADKRLDARQSLAAATAAMSPRERAVVDLLLIKGRNIRDLATAANTTVEALDQLLHQAADTLAAHYQTREAA